MSAATAAAWAVSAMDAERAMVWPVAPAPGEVFVLLHATVCQVMRPPSEQAEPGKVLASPNPTS